MSIHHLPYREVLRLESPKVFLYQFGESAEMETADIFMCFLVCFRRI